MKPWIVHLAHHGQSEAFGVALGAILQAGDAVGMIGELGTGKTTLCRGMGRGLECVTDLRSPSYLLCHEIHGRIPVLHMDAYFEERMDSLLGEGLCERFDDQHVLLIEWADRLKDWWPADRLEIRLKVDGDGRTAEIRGLGSRAQKRLQELQISWEMGGIH